MPVKEKEVLKFVSRFAVVTCALAGLTMAPAAEAAPITYNVTLKAPAGNPSLGTGSFTIDGSDYAGVSNEFFTPTNPAKTLLAISFDIDGKHFDLADAIGGFAQVFFQNGNVAGITYQGVDGGNTAISLNVGALGYVYADFTTGHSSIGAVSAALAAPTTNVPEPASLLVLGAGLAGLAAAGIGRRRQTA